MTEASCVTLYPRYCFHLSPTVNTWCLLRASEIHGLDQHAGFEGEKFYFYKNLPIKWVRIVGVVVGIDDIAGRRFYYVDDSSGMTIQAITPLSIPTRTTEADPHGDGTLGPALDQDPGPYPEVVVGSVADIKGCVSMFREEYQISVEKMGVVEGTARELALWEKRAKFRREVLDKPWVLREKDIHRCRKEAERSGEGLVDRRKRRDDKERRKEDGGPEGGSEDARRRRRSPSHAEDAGEGVREKRKRRKADYSALGL